MIRSSASALYAYCVSDEISDAVLDSVTGLDEAKPRLIRYDGIGVVVSDFEGELVPVTRQNVLRHDRVISSVLRGTSPLPFRFGSLLNLARLDRYVERNRESLLAMLERVRGSVEMSVKIISQPPSGDDAPKPGKGVGKGTLFLETKRRELTEGETDEERAREVSSWLAECLAGAVKDSSVRLRPTRALILAAAHLVQRERLGEYRERIESARLARPELHFLTSGPWATYSFCDLTVDLL